jgi:Tol biopolymer transport system component
MRPQLVVTMALALSFTWTATGQAQETAEELYQEGLYQEEVQGDLEQAIAIYQSILSDHPDSRAVAVKAQLHIGLCYEMLGLNEAQRAYQRVIDDYAEYRDEVSVARRRLASLAEELAELARRPTFRKIEIASKPQNGVLSPDGSKLAFTSEGSVWVVPIQGNVGPDIAGEPIQLTEPVGARTMGNLGLSWSADGEWIAFNAEQDEEPVIHVVPAAGGEQKKIPGNHFRGAYAMSYRISLSPDGNTLAFAYDDPEVEAEDSPYSQVFLSIYTTPVEGGQPTKLTPVWSIEPAFSPDGRFVAYLKFARAEDEDLGDGYGWYRELWMVPSAGGTPVLLADSIAARGPVWSPDARMIAFIREPGGESEGEEIWVVPVSEGEAGAADPLKIPLPRGSQHPLAGWTPRNELGVFMNTPYHQAVYTVPAEGGKAVQITTDGFAFHPRWTPDGKTIVYRGGDRFWLAAVPAGGGAATEIPSVSDLEITPGIPGGGVHVSPDGQKILFMGATRQPLRVNIFTLPIEGGVPTQVTETLSVPEMDTQDRYPCWSPDGDRIAFIRYRSDRRVAKGDFSMNIYVVSAEGGEPTATTTDADSVAWAAIAYSPDGNRLAYFSNDAIKVRPAAGGEARVVAKLERVHFHSELAWSPDGNRIAYTDRRRIWTVRTDGGEPVEVKTGVLAEDAENLHIDWSPDGRRIVFAASMGGKPEFWLISDFLPPGR